MLEKIICIDNVGVLRHAIPRATALHAITLIYADNARGKSTLSALLMACSMANAKEVLSRKTVGSTALPKVNLRFGSTPSNAAPFNSEFDGAAWSGPLPKLHVFNQAFVERNVFAGSGVLPEHREALLAIALGDAAVVERKKFEAQSARQRECAGKVATAELALIGFRGPFSVDEFLALQALANADEMLRDLDRQVSEARSAAQIASRPEFRPVHVPRFDLTDLTEVLGSSFESMAARAEEIAKAHFSRHNGSVTERWVAEGLNHGPERECPFCGQPTGELGLR